VRLGAAALVLALAPAVALAAPGCRVPPNLETPQIEAASPGQPPRVVAISGYTLAMIWTPQHCFHAVGGAEAFRCTADRSGFVLHGLWPDGEGGSWPQWCAATAILPRKTIAAHYCATPSAQLLQHEWAKHGTCIAGATPDSYFDQSNRLFNALRFPDMEALARSPLAEGAFAEAFADANPGLSADMVRLNLDKQGWLQEVWLCLDQAFRATRCIAPGKPDRAVRIRLGA
jgi:ribonuclease T2